MEANPDFKQGPTPARTTDFVIQIETANSSCSDFSEDDSGPNWGHYQFTAGSMTITSVLQSWESVGSTEMACKLIALTIKTCQVARQMCFEQGAKTFSYLSDAYLENLIDVLWKLWTEAGGVSSIASVINCFSS